MPLAAPALPLENAAARSTDIHISPDDSAARPSSSSLLALSTPCILQQVPEVCTQHTPDAACSCLNHAGSTRLITDEEDKDYYIVSSADTAELSIPSIEGCHGSLLTKFSQPVDGQSSPARYIRCSSSQLEDCTAWYSEQQNNPIVVPDIQLDVNARSLPTLTNLEKILCQDQLVATLQSWSKTERRVAMMTLYCAANSVRDLARPELVAMVKMGMRITAQTAEFIPDNDQFANLVESSISNLGQIMLLRHSGEMVFKNALMKNFIRQLNIPDFHGGHSMLTRICFQQIREWGAALVIQPWYRFRSWFHSLSEWPLIPYVVRNWFLHYRMTPDSAEMNLEFYQLLKEALLDNMPKQPSMLLERRIVDAGYDLSQIYHLPELEAVFRNMGAYTASAKNTVLGRVPTKSQWYRMKRIELLTSQPNYQTWMSGHSASDEKNVEIDEDSMSDVIVVNLRALDISSDSSHGDVEDSETSRSTSFLSAAEIPLESTNANELSLDVDWVKIANADIEMKDEA